MVRIIVIGGAFLMKAGVIVGIILIAAGHLRGRRAGELQERSRGVEDRRARGVGQGVTSRSALDRRDRDRRRRRAGLCRPARIETLDEP